MKIVIGGLCVLITCFFSCSVLGSNRHASSPKTYAGVAGPELNSGSSQARLEQLLVSVRSRPILKKTGRQAHHLKVLDWSVIASRFVVRHAEQWPAVQLEIKQVLQHRQQFEKRLLDAQPYLSYVAQQALARSLPSEMVLLPLLVSDYQPGYRSMTDCAGLWSMCATNHVASGVEMNWWVDNRYQVTVSTDVVFDQMQRDFFHLHSWVLVWIQYFSQCHEYSSSIRKESIKKKLAQLLAYSYVIKNAHRYGITLPDINSSPTLYAVPLHLQLDVEQIARLSGLTVDRVKQWNPALRQFSTSTIGGYALVLPPSAYKQFMLNRPYFSDHAHQRWQMYPVYNDATWRELAVLAHLSVSRLKQVNRHQSLSLGASILWPVQLSPSEALQQVGLLS